MANNKPENSKAEVQEVMEVKEVKTPEKPKAPAYITKYTIQELADAGKQAFGADKVIVLTALTMAGKESYSMEEAKRIVTEFRNKEVRN